MKKRIDMSLTAILSLAWLIGGCDYSSREYGEVDDNTSDQPNILLIVADDLGYSDIGVYGGEINTPNIDRLARDGIQLTDFHTGMSCAPTRAMLLTGIDHHRVGLGASEETLNLFAPHLRAYPGYEGFLNANVPTLPELLRGVGYRTYMTGKWHMGSADDNSPRSRGFDRSFVLLDGAAGHFNDKQVVPGSEKETVTYREDGEITALPDGFYSSRFYAHKLIDYLESDNNNSQPFFAYLAFTAPHWPIQAPDESIEKYAGRYDDGFEALFQERLQRQKALGLVAESVVGQPLPPGAAKWSQLSEEARRQSARSMEVYAAMVDDMDRYIGEVIQTLKDTGQYENTLVVFISDNGADARALARTPALQKLAEICCDNSTENLGRPDSFVLYGPEWARASTAPGKFFKSFPTQGGVRNPAIISFPKLGVGGARYQEFASVLDLVPTFLELAGAEYPAGESPGESPTRLQGASLVPVIEGGTEPIHSDDYAMGWETLGRRALRRGDWKVVSLPPPLGNSEWQLYNLQTDPAESRDVSTDHPEVLTELIAAWDIYAKTNGVVQPESGATR